MNIVRRLTYKSGVMNLARTLHLTDILRSAYFRCVTSSGGVVTLETAGAEGKFYVRSPEQLRFFESYFALEKLFLQALVSTLAPGDVFFDVGSNVGKIAVPVANLVGEMGRVFAFEPKAEFCTVLESHLRLNGLRNVEICRVALGEKSMTAQLFAQEGVCPSLLPGKRNGASCSQTTETVQVLEGDRLCETQNIPIPRAVKIDVEGYEYSVLRGLKRTLADPACELLCLEVHPKMLPGVTTPEAVLDLVRDLGFQSIESSSRVNEILLVARKTLAD